MYSTAGNSLQDGASVVPAETCRVRENVYTVTTVAKCVATSAVACGLALDGVIGDTPMVWLVTRWMMMPAVRCQPYS